MDDDLIREGLRRAFEEGEKQKAHEKSIKEERQAKAADTARRNAADSARAQSAQQSFDFGGPEKNKMVDLDKVDRARARNAEFEEFKDKRVKSSPLIAEAELAKMKELTAPKPRGGGGGGGASGGAGGIELEGKMGRNTKPKMKAGGKVKSASSRADGCCIRGKTRA